MHESNFFKPQSFELRWSTFKVLCFGRFFIVGKFVNWLIDLRFPLTPPGFGQLDQDTCLHNIVDILHLF